MFSRSIIDKTNYMQLPMQLLRKYVQCDCEFKRTRYLYNSIPEGTGSCGFFMKYPVLINSEQTLLNLWKKLHG